MKIAQFINSTDADGAETLVLNLTQELLKLNVDAEIHAFTDSWIIKQCIDLGLPCVPLGCNISKVYSIRKLPLWGIRYGKLLKQRDIDVLHSHLYGATIRGAAGALFAGIKHAATQHDNYSIDQKTKSRVRWLNIAGILGTQFAMISNQMMLYYTERGLKEKYCHFVYNGVNEDTFKYNWAYCNKIKKDLNINNEVVFIAPGRLEPIKGFDVLIQALDKVRGKNWRLLILGDGSERSWLEEMVLHKQLGNKITFIGAVNNVDEYLSAADAFVLASRNEGLPCSIIEAMLTGLPIIATEVGGNSELVKHGVNGFLVQSEDVADLAERLGQMIDIVEQGRYAATDNVYEVVTDSSIAAGGGQDEQNSTYILMRRASLEHAQNFTLNKMAKNYISLYNGVCLN